MAENTIPTLMLSPDEHNRLTELAQERGYDSLDAYLMALVEADDFEERFKRAFRDALRGDVLSEDEFWAAVNDDE
jgi:hypothetical protein